MNLMKQSVLHADIFATLVSPSLANTETSMKADATAMKQAGWYCYHEVASSAGYVYFCGSRSGTDA